MHTEFVKADADVPHVLTSSGAASERLPASSGHPEDRQHHLIQLAFRTAGGVASGDQVAYLLRDQINQPISTVARWIVGREVVSYEWRCQPMLPLFQFDLPRVVIRAPVAEVIRELRDVYSDRCLAMWFVKPNVSLAGAKPIHVIGERPCAVLDAARADRLVVRH